MELVTNMKTKWNDIHFILNEKGHVIGDYKRGTAPYGFLRDRKGFTFDEATVEERQMLVNLVYLFFTVGDTQFHNGYEYVELEGYMMYRKVVQSTLYNDLFYRASEVPEGHYLYLTVCDDTDEYYVMTVIDEGFVDAVVSHFAKDYGIDMDVEVIQADTPQEVMYWNKSVTALSV